MERAQRLSRIERPGGAPIPNFPRRLSREVSREAPPTEPTAMEVPSLQERTWAEDIAELAYVKQDIAEFANIRHANGPGWKGGMPYLASCPLDIMLEGHAPTGRCPPHRGKLRANGTFHLGKNGVTRQCGPIRSTKHWIPSGYRPELSRIPWIPSTPV